MYPTDVVKTRQQLGSGKTIGMIQQFRDIIKLEGFGNLYRGTLTYAGPGHTVSVRCFSSSHLLRSQFTDVARLQLRCCLHYAL
jgi:hypothetical protein